MPLSRYNVKRGLLAPRTALRRRRHPQADRMGRTMLELHYYSTPMIEFMKQSARNPDILVEADIDSNSTVIDVGAYVGEWAEQISDRYGSTIYAYEPNPKAVRRMKKRLGERETVHPRAFGLGPSDSTVQIALAGPGSFVTDGTTDHETANAKIRDVATVLDELDVDEIDLMKLNIEGAEFDVFDRLIETDWLRRIRIVSVQFHEWHPNAYRRRRAVRRALARTHEEKWCYDWVWELWQRP